MRLRTAGAVRDELLMSRVAHPCSVSAVETRFPEREAPALMMAFEICACTCPARTSAPVLFELARL